MVARASSSISVAKVLEPSFCHYHYSARVCPEEHSCYCVAGLRFERVARTMRAQGVMLWFQTPCVIVYSDMRA